MYMAPITRAAPVAARPALRRAVGLPVLLLAALVGLPWLLLNIATAAAMLLVRFLVQAVDYAGQVALGR